MIFLLFQFTFVFCGVAESMNIPPSIWVIRSLGLNAKTDIISEIPNSNVVLQKEEQKVTLLCKAHYPIKWNYLYNNISLPILETNYHRTAENLTDISNFTFLATVTLRGLQEYQTGKYVCRHFNQRYQNNSYDVSSYFNIFVPGNHIIVSNNNINFVNKSDISVVVRCPVSHPEYKVRLFKLNELVFQRTQEIKWKSITTLYNPSQGFILNYGLGREIFGTYNCTAVGGNTSVISIIANVEEKEHYKNSWNMNDCFQDVNFMKFVRSKRLECFCKTSYGLFVNDNFEEENRKAQCNNWAVPDNCSDWRIHEFFENGEDSENSCYFHERPFSGSGARGGILASKVEYKSNDSWMTNVSVVFNGFDSWASGSQLGIRRKSHNIQQLEIISQEATFETHFPLAQSRAEWINVSVSGKDVISVHAFQPDSFSYEWFQFSTDIFSDFNISGMESFSNRDFVKAISSSTTHYISNTNSQSVLLYSLIVSIYHVVKYFKIN